MRNRKLKTHRVTQVLLPKASINGVGLTNVNCDLCEVLMGSQGYRYNTSPSGFSFSQGEQKSKRPRVLCILPCTVSQLTSAIEDKDTFFMQGKEINQVSVVGIVRKTVPAATYVMYSLDDMTGPPIDVKEWMDLEDASLNACVIPPGTYIKVVGSLRSFQHCRSIVAFSIRRLDDLNEITSHMLEVVQASLLSDQYSIKHINKAIPSSVMNISYASDPATFGFTYNQLQVFNLINSCSAAEGMSVQKLSSELKSLSSYDIRTCLQFLLNEGHIFSTTDENHFKSAHV